MKANLYIVPAAIIAALMAMQAQAVQKPIIHDPCHVDDGIFDAGQCYSGVTAEAEQRCQDLGIKKGTPGWNRCVETEREYIPINNNDSGDGLSQANIMTTLDGKPAMLNGTVISIYRVTAVSDRTPSSTPIATIKGSSGTWQGVPGTYRAQVSGGGAPYAARLFTIIGNTPAEVIIPRD